MEIFVPGRLAILGEHTDWICSYRGRENPYLDVGLCLVCATNEGIHARVSRVEPETDTGSTEKPNLVFEHVDAKGETKSFESAYDLDYLESVARDERSFFSYVAGATASVLESYFSNGKSNGKKELELISINISNYKTTLPMGRGLSSSAAISVLVVKCFNEIYELGMTMNEIMAVAYRGERKTRSQCGMMDFCVVMGQNTAALMTMAEGGYCRLNLIKNKEPLHFVVADLRADPPKNTVEILSSLNGCFPLPSGGGELLRGQLNMHNYAHDSATLCLNSVDAIEKGDTASLAKMMTKAQHSFDAGATLVCPSQLKAPYLHRAIEKLGEVSGALAVKGVGSQGDGSVQVLCEDAAAQARVLERLSKADIGAEGFFLTLPSQPQEAEGGTSPTSLVQSRVPIAVLVVKRGQGRERGRQRQVQAMETFGLDPVSAAEAAILSCGVEWVCTVFEYDEEASPGAVTATVTGGAGTGEEKKKENVDDAADEPTLAYGRYLQKTRLDTQCTRVQAAAGGSKELHTAMMKAIEAYMGSVSPPATDATQVLMCSSEQDDLPRDVFRRLQQQDTSGDQRIQVLSVGKLREDAVLF